MSTVKFDKGKPSFRLLPLKTLAGVNNVLEFGAKKYAENNWRHGTNWSRFYDAALRHVSSWGEREEIDPETGENHLDHAICCLLFLRHYSLHGLGVDDRQGYDGTILPEQMELELEETD